FGAPEGVGMNHPPKRRKPPAVNPAARRNRIWRLGLHGIATFAILALSGCDRQAHLLADRARQKSAHGMSLPACGFHQLFGSSATGPLEQFKDRGGFAAIPCGSALLFALRRFVRFLGRGGLLSRLALLRRNARALFANTGRFRGLRLGARYGRG